MNEQQNQVVSQQRLALVQRQAEMSSIDARIAQLQVRLQRKRALNQRLSQQIQNKQQQQSPNSNGPMSPGTFSEPKSRPAGNIAAIEPYSHIPNDNDFGLNKNDPKYQTLPYNTKFTLNFKPTATSTTTNNGGTEDDVNKNKIQQQQQQHSSSTQQQQQNLAAQKTIAQQLQQFAHHQIAHSQSQAHVQGI